MTQLHLGADPIMNSDNPTKTVRLQVKAELIAACFTPLLTKGIRLMACLECSLKELLCDQLGLAEDYLENRIQTVFLDGHPVDDVGRATVGEGATIALSAAMPGLVGAVLRKGGPLAALRKDITYSSDSTGHEVCDGSVTVKLFNMTTREIGPLLLKRGVWLKGTELREIFDRCTDILSNSCRQAFYNDIPISIASLMERIKSEDGILLQVTID